MSQSQNDKSNITKIDGYWYPAGSSARYQANLRVDSLSGQFDLQAEQATQQQQENSASSPPDSIARQNAEQGAVQKRIHQQGSWNSIKVSSRMGNTPRKLTMADSSLFETVANEQIDQLLIGTSHTSRGGTLASRLERSWPFVLCSLVGIVLCAFLFIVYGVPAGARYVAHKIPVAAHEKISERTLESFDDFFLEETQLSEEQQTAQHQSFQRLLDQLPENEHTFTLHLRKMRDIPNAFALPSGDVLLTDALVTLAENQEEIESVMLHEIGHVIHRHGMQQVLQGSAITLLVTMALGDLSGIGQVITAVPVFLVQSSYSRKAELQADEYAFENMQNMGMDTIHFANFITRMGKFRLSPEEKEDEPRDSTTSESKDNEPKELPYYLSSHPLTTERANRARQLSDSLTTE